MSRRTRIKVFEHQYIKIGEEGFEEDHFSRLVHYNELHGNKYFLVGYKKIKFTSYVGVLQVGNLTIEILPKADNTTNYEKWTSALLTMLYVCKKISLRSVSEAWVKLRSASILDLIFESFLFEIENLTSIGLIKGYRFNEANQPRLKGKIVFSKHLASNIAHKECFYTRHEIYDYNIVWNQVLKKALTIMLRTVENATLKNRTSQLLWHFDTVDTTNIDKSVFDKLRYSRKTDGYKKAVKLSELIILSFTPDIQFGKNDVLGILFDMNLLFEEYIYRILKKEENEFSDINLEIRPQEKKLFWSNRKIRPDLVLYYDEEQPRKLIMDTKWKILNDYTPSDDDLRQMYTYNLHFDAEKSILLYPKLNLTNQDPVVYAQAASVSKEHACQIVFADLFDSEGKPKKDAGRRLLRYLLRN